MVLGKVWIALYNSSGLVGDKVGVFPGLGGMDHGKRPLVGDKRPPVLGSDIHMKLKNVGPKLCPSAIWIGGLPSRN